MKQFDLRGQSYGSDGTMRIKLNQGTPGSGVRGGTGEHLEQGGVHVVPDYDGQQLINDGRATLAPEPTIQPDVVQVADPIAINRDPKSASRKPASRKSGK